jgi:folate-binding protein YgfZ
MPYLHSYYTSNSQDKMDTAITLCHLKQHQLLLVNGPDAKKFLQGQVTCDINALDNQGNASVSAPLGAHCTHKGRIVFSFRAVQLPSDTESQEVALSIPSDISDIAISSLKKYSVFSKADISIDDDTYQLFGVNGKDANIALQMLAEDQDIAFNIIPTETNTAIHTSAGTIICIAKECYELWLNTEQAQRFTAKVTNKTVVDEEHWNEIKVKAGIADIHADTSGIFTPHAMNYHNIGNAVSFSKGCYTGQEVVARMQYLGQLKRQLYAFTSKAFIPSGLSAGDSLYIKDKTKSVGDIAMVSHYNQQTYLLASTIVEHAEKDAIFADTHYEHPLQRVTY